jgi:hypothetical protein
MQPVSWGQGEQLDECGGLPAPPGHLRDGATAQGDPELTQELYSKLVHPSVSARHVHR